MYNILNSFDYDRDFFEANPQLKIIFPDISSKIMWAIALLHHPESKFKSDTYEVRKSIIINDWLGDPDFDFEDEKLQPTIEKFVSRCLTKKQRILNDWEEKLDERTALLKTIPYTVDTLEFLDKAKVQSTKLWEGYMKALKDVEEEMAVYITGNSVESATESGLI